MRTYLVVMLSPILDQPLGFDQSVEDLPVERFVKDGFVGATGLSLPLNDSI